MDILSAIKSEVKMAIFSIVGIVFVLAGLFTKTINTGGNKPYPLKWYHRLLGICVGLASIVTAVELYWER